MEQKEVRLDEMAVKNKRELLPSTFEERTVSTFGYMALWVGMGVIIATYSMGGLQIENLTLGWVIFSCLLANIVCGIFITLSGDIGVEHGIAFPVFLRATFGPVGSVVPSIIRGGLAVCWTGIQTYYGATAIAFIVAYFTGFDHWYICFLVYLAAQIANAFFGITGIEKFAALAAPCIIVISIYIIIHMMGVADTNGIDVWHSVYVPGSGAMFSKAGVATAIFMAAVSTNMSYWSTSAADTQSLTKYVKAPIGERNWFKRNARCIMGHVVVLPIIQTFCVMTGALAMLVFDDWNPITAIEKTATGGLLIVLLLLIVLAQWSTNTSASILPAAMTFMNIGQMLFKKQLPYRAAVIIVGILAAVSFPWEIMARFGGFMDVMGAAYGPICGVFMADYYFLRRRRLNVGDLYEGKNGQFWGIGGWNIPGIAAIIFGIIMALSFSGFSFFMGIGSAFVFYLIFGKLWFKKFKQAEIESGYDDKYLGISNNNFWTDVLEREMQR